jgi:hypothetical protein
MLQAIFLPSLHRRAFREGGVTVRRGGGCSLAWLASEAHRHCCRRARGDHGQGLQTFFCASALNLYSLSSYWLLCILRCIQVI